MIRRTLLPLSLLVCLFAAFAPTPAVAQKKPAAKAAAVAEAAPKITTPKEELGFNLGDDYSLATYTQLGTYWQKLAKESPRMKLVEIGKTEEGRPHWMAIVTSPENQKNLEHYREISYKLAHAEGLTEDQAHALALEGKAVVWIDGSLHATEVVGGQQLMEMVYQMVSRTDPETMRILNDVIILFVDANPDGHELVSNWYMREKDPLKRSMAGLPRLYSKYTGHDDNRDFYMSAMSESTNMNKVLYLEWCPQIMYNHHQTGPIGTVLFAPPFRPPHNYNLDPLTQTGLDLVGAAMHNRFIAENKPGSTMRKGTTYSTWFNGGLRTTTYFHNMIGLLTEIIGNPTPMEIPFRPERVLPNEDLPFPIAPQAWHFRQSIDYSVTANRAVLDLASRMREEFLYNIYIMGRNSIQHGNEDHWTLTPKRMLEAVGEIQKDMAASGEGGGAGAGGGRGGRGGGGRGGAAAAPAQAGPPEVAGGGGRGQAAPGVIGGPAALTIGNVPPKYYETVVHDPKHRDPRGYIIPSDQPDFLTATKFINTLVKNGITIHRATSSFTVQGKTYPAGSWVVKCAQAFRPHVLDMFEPQWHPDDIPYPGGAPTPPYDAAGYTLAYQMGVQFDRVLENFDGPFEKVTGYAKPPAGTVGGAGSPAGYTFSHATNDSFIAVNRLLKAGEQVEWIGSNTMFVLARPSTKAILDKLASDFGLNFTSVTSRPVGDDVRLKAVRIGLVDTYGGSMPSGWTRFIFDQFEFPYKVVFSKELDAGNLNSKFDVLVFPSGTIRAGGGGRGGAGGGGGGRGGAPAGPDAEFFGGQVTEDRVPPEWRPMMGRITTETTLPQIRNFVRGGGTIVSIGPSTEIAEMLDLPVQNFLVEHPTASPLPRTKYYVPGSVLRASIDNTNPIAYGFTKNVDVFFDNSPVFELKPEASINGAVKPLMWFDSDTPLRSGWAWGEHYLKGGVIGATAKVGDGHLYFFGPEITFRSQPHGTYKLLFNSIYYGPVAK